MQEPIYAWPLFKLWKVTSFEGDAQIHMLSNMGLQHFGESRKVALLERMWPQGRCQRIKSLILG